MPTQHSGGRPYKPRRDLDPMVLRLIENSPSYEPRATVNDGLCINEVSYVSAEQTQSGPVLHAKWQEEGHVDRLTEEECEALARAGYRIHRDRDGYWAWWREKKLSHLRLTVATSGWMASKAAHPKGATWRTIGSFVSPMVPYFEDYPVTPQAIVREGLTLALCNIREDVPDRIFSDKFFEVLKKLCDEAVENLEKDDEWFNDILLKVPLVNASQSQAPPQMDAASESTEESEYTGPVEKS